MLRLNTLELEAAEDPQRLHQRVGRYAEQRAAADAPTWLIQEPSAPRQLESASRAAVQGPPGFALQLHRVTPGGVLSPPPEPARIAVFIVVRGELRDSSGETLTPRSLRNAMLDVTAAPQDRWFARLYLWKGTAVAVLALFWIATGLIALTAAREQSVDLMQQAVPAGLSAGALATLTSLLDISLGCAIAVARTSQAGLISGIALTLVYLLFGSLLSPHLWLDPLGAYTKDLPMLLAMVAALAVSRDR